MSLKGISAKYFLFGGFIGIGLLIGLIRFVPDGKLHVVFCDVGQGDAIYLRMPNLADVLVDGGPNNKVLTCLGKHMPFYDRTIDVVVLTHPQKDHLQGLIDVLERYTVKYFVTVPVSNSTEGYASLQKQILNKRIEVKYLTTRDRIEYDEVSIVTIWPELKWLSDALNHSNLEELLTQKQTTDVLGFTSDKNINLFSLYLHLKFKNFDLLLTGDGDSQTQNEIAKLRLNSIIPQNIELLKVPHHGSRTAMTYEFVELIRPKLSVIQVGKNSYGHPSQEAMNQLSKWGKVLRTDQSGDIEIVTNGNSWEIKNNVH